MKESQPRKDKKKLNKKELEEEDKVNKKGQGMQTKDFIGIIVGALFIGYITRSIIGAIVGGFLGYYFVREQHG